MTRTATLTRSHIKPIDDTDLLFGHTNRSNRSEDDNLGPSLRVHCSRAILDGLNTMMVDGRAANKVIILCLPSPFTVPLPHYISSSRTLQKQLSKPITIVLVGYAFSLHEIVQYYVMPTHHGPPPKDGVTAPFLNCH